MSKSISIEEFVKRIQNSKTRDEQNIVGPSLQSFNSALVEVPFSKNKFVSLSIMEEILNLMGMNEEDGSALFYELYLKLAAVAKKYEKEFKYYHILYLTAENLNQSFAWQDLSLKQIDNISKYAIYDDNPYLVKGVFLSPKDLTMNKVYACHTILHETAHTCIPIAHPSKSIKEHEATWLIDTLGKDILKYELIADVFSIYVLKELFAPHKRAFRETIKRTHFATKSCKRYFGKNFNCKSLVDNIDKIRERLVQDIKKTQD